MHITIMLRSALVVLAMTPSAVWADFDPEAYPRHETCALCHGLFGVSHNAKFPHLAGQDADYLTAQLKAFLSGTRVNDDGQMAAIVTELLPGDIEKVVVWFSSQDAPTAQPSLSSQTGENLFAELGCAKCHLGDTLDGVPHLSAQRNGYLAKQMRDFRDETRTHAEVGELHRDHLEISDADIDEIANYLAAKERDL